MAVIMRMHWAEVTPEQYDQACDTVAWERDAPDGGMLHVAWFDGGLRIWDAWESAEAFGEFTQTRLMPGVQALGFGGEPQVEILPAHGIQSALAWAPGAVLELGAFPRANYDALRDRVGWVDAPPAGGVCHLAAEAGETVETLSVWQGAEDLGRFVESRIAPAMIELAIEPTGAEPVFHTVYRLFDASKAHAAA